MAPSKTTRGLYNELQMDHGLVGLNSADLAIDRTVVDSSSNSEAEHQRRAESRARSSANLRPFKAGDRGNPRGRPKKDYDLAARAQEHAQKAIDKLAECLDDPKAAWSSKIAAAAELLDRGFGSAPKSLDVKHSLTIGEEFDRFIRKLQGIDEPPPALLVEGDISDVR